MTHDLLLILAFAGILSVLFLDIVRARHNVRRFRDYVRRLDMQHITDRNVHDSQIRTAYLKITQNQNELGLLRESTGGFWTTAHGTVLQIRQMSDGHLKAAMEYLIERNEQDSKGYRSLRAEKKRRAYDLRMRREQDRIPTLSFPKDSFKKSMEIANDRVFKVLQGERDGKPFRKIDPELKEFISDKVKSGNMSELMASVERRRVVTPSHEISSEFQSRLDLLRAVNRIVSILGWRLPANRSDRNWDTLTSLREEVNRTSTCFEALRRKAEDFYYAGIWVNDQVTHAGCAQMFETLRDVLGLTPRDAVTVKKQEDTDVCSDTKRAIEALNGESLRRTDR